MDRDLRPLVATGLACAIVFVGFAVLPPAMARDQHAIMHQLIRFPVMLGILVPFCAFGFGALSHRPLPSLVVAAFSVYMVLAFINPVTNYLDVVRPDFYPLGPLTPGTLVQLLVMAKADPTAAVYPLAVENPFGRPANHIGYALLAPFAWAMFTILSGLLGRRVAGRLSPIKYRRTVLAYALVSALAFIMPMMVVGNLIRRSPGVPALLGPILSLLPHVAALAIIKNRRPSPELFVPEPLRLVDD